MKRYVVWMVLFLFLLTGCRREPTVGEQVIVTGIGITERDGIWTLSIQAVDALKTAGSLSEQNESATAVYTATGASVAEALQGFLNETGKRTYILQNKLLAIGMEDCRRNRLSLILDYFIRNQEGRALVDVVVCRGDPSALLDITTGSDAIPAEYVSQMLDEGNRYAGAMQTRLLDVERTSTGMYDLMAPIVEVTDGTPHLVGTAVFLDGVLCDELTMQETGGMLLAGGYSERYLYTVEDTTFRLEDIRTHITVEPADNAWRYRFTVSGVATVVEDNAQTEPHRLLQVAQTAIAADAEAALTRIVCERGSDPLGLARLTAMRYRRDGATPVAVHDALRDSTVEVTAAFSLVDSGFIRK